ncbi:MAG: hypothetical protein AAGE52_40760, partial [Myxococcota bacterium]
VIQEPVIQEPVIQEPVIQEPVIQAPVIQAPVAEPTPLETPTTKPESEEFDTVGFRIFGAHTGALLGSGGLVASLATESRGGVYASMYPILSGAALLGALFHGQAKRHRWNPRVGSALAGLYPGLLHGTLTGLLVSRQMELRRSQERVAVIGGAALSTLLFMGLHSRSGGRELRRGIGFFYLLIAGAALSALPFARAFDRPEAIGWASVAGASLSLILTTSKQW